VLAILFLIFFNSQINSKVLKQVINFLHLVLTKGFSGFVAMQVRRGRYCKHVLISGQLTHRHWWYKWRFLFPGCD